MPTIVPSIVSQELSLRHRVALRLSALLAVWLLAIGCKTRPRSLPSFALTRLSNTSRTIPMSVLGERSAGSSRLLLLLSVNVVQAVHATLVVLAANVEVEAESCDG